MNRRNFLAAALAIPFIGKRDDMTRLQAKIDRLSARGGGTVRLPKGTRRIAGIYMPPNVRLIGS